MASYSFPGRVRMCSATGMNRTPISGKVSNSRPIPQPLRAVVLNNKDKPITDAFGNEANPFLFGSGHFMPKQAADPGLVYDASYEDYLLYLCSIGYNLKDLTPNFRCPTNPPAPHDLNYPSIAIPQLQGTVVTYRTVTNVGSNRSVYYSLVKAPLGVSVNIYPPILYFNESGEKKTFTITIQAENLEGAYYFAKNKYQFGWYTWRDSFGTYNVRSPIAVALA